MDGGIGQCRNPACMQLEALTEDGFCTEECRMQVTGCSVPGCGCAGADNGVSRCTDCELYAAGVVDGRCPDCRVPAITTTIEVAPGVGSWRLPGGIGNVDRAPGARS
jgi:hypothetical protein